MRRPLLFLLMAMMVAAVVNPGNFGTIDTWRRLQVSRWIRLGEPQVRPGDQSFGLVNRWGERQAWYGIGQSLVMVPFDWAVSSSVSPVARRLGFDAAVQEQIVELLIAFLMQSLLTACSLALGYEVLTLLGFKEQAALAGVLALLFASTCLYYVQTAHENSLLLATSLAALYGVLHCRQSGGARWAVLSGCACGMAIVTRLPSLLETSVFFALALFLGCGVRRFSRGFVPPVMAGLAIDRWYQWHRFGNVLHTYATEMGQQLAHSGNAAGFPFSYPFWKGFWGTFFSPDKSIFLFDPLLVVLMVAAAWNWRKMESRLRRTLAALAAMLLVYVVLYARYFDFGGDVAWAHRFVAVPAELLALFAVPLLMTLPRAMRWGAWLLVAVSVVLQAASTTMVPNVEVMQRERGYNNGVIVNRVVNLVDLARGQTGGPRFSGLPPEWRTLAYLPFQMQFRFPTLSKYGIGLWVVLLLALPLLCWAGFSLRRTSVRPRSKGALP